MSRTHEQSALNTETANESPEQLKNFRPEHQYGDDRRRVAFRLVFRDPATKTILADTCVDANLIDVKLQEGLKAARCLAKIEKLPKSRSLKYLEPHKMGKQRK